VSLRAGSSTSWSRSHRSRESSAAGSNLGAVSVGAWPTRSSTSHAAWRARVSSRAGRLCDRRSRTAASLRSRVGSFVRGSGPRMVAPATFRTAAARSLCPPGPRRCSGSSIALSAPGAGRRASWAVSNTGRHSHRSTAARVGRWPPR
jgi:hypothetical protein